MLVLTRRENERILLPDVGITVSLMSVSGNRARLGISAPENIRILREEVAGSAEVVHKALAKGPISREMAHALRNRINAAMLAVEMVRLQTLSENTAGAVEAIDKVTSELHSLAGLLQSQPKGETEAKRPQRRWKTLLVEDDANESNLLAAYLRMTGFDVDTAGDGADALDWLRSHERPDVVLLDMLMPRCDGPTTVDRIRRDPNLQGMKVYAVSGTSPMRFGLKTGPDGVDRWFCKPLDPRQLVKEIDTELAAAHGNS